MALSMLKGIGPVNARNLVAYCGGVDALFSDRSIRKKLELVPGIGPRHLATILDRGVLKAAEKEWNLVQRNGVRMVFYLDPDYPYRLRQAPDAPVVLFADGKASLDPARAVAIVGTRAPTEQGKHLCEELVEGLADSGATIISGLAYGIDIIAHRTALRVGLPTIAVVAHGLDRVYPGEHRATAREMVRSNGAVASELPHGSPFAPGNFPARNRIIAGLCDCTIVVESGPKGGSLITAEIANGYDREVMAFPGRPSDPRSEGCNRLVQRDQAYLVTDARDVLDRMDWLPKTGRRKATQMPLFSDLLPDEQVLVDILREHGRTDIDELCLKSRMPQGKAASLLLNMEFNGVVRALPGKCYALNGPGGRP